MGYMNRHGRVRRIKLCKMFEDNVQVSPYGARSPKRESATGGRSHRSIAQPSNQCLALANTAADPQVRASMMLMARRFHELATRPQRGVLSDSPRSHIIRHTVSQD